jgi:pyruvate,water dikinase
MDPLVARERIVERREAMEADAGIEIDDIVCGEDVAPVAGEVPEEGDCLVGIPGSSGLAKGYARVVTDPYEFKPDPLGNDILVVPFMDVGWTPLFSDLKAIVADTGGQLSHSAIIAREFGVPAVVSVRGATRLIADGQPLTVDGNRGIVHLKHLD